MLKYLFHVVMIGIMVLGQFQGCSGDDPGNGTAPEARSTVSGSGKYDDDCDNSTAKACNATTMVCGTKTEVNGTAVLWAKCLCKTPTYYHNSNNLTQTLEPCVRVNFTEIIDNLHDAGHGILPTLALHQLILLSILTFVSISILTTG